MDVSHELQALNLTVDDAMCYSDRVDAILRAKKVDAEGYTKEERFHVQQKFFMKRGEKEATSQHTTSKTKSREDLRF